MAQFTSFIGIDISKAWFDFEVVGSQGEPLYSGRHQNNSRGFAKLVKDCRNIKGLVPEETLVCIEHTGIYIRPLVQYWTLKDIKMPLWIANGGDVKRTTANPRGKSDSADAGRISQYCYRYQDLARPWKPENTRVTELRDLISTRRRLCKTRDSHTVALNEMKTCDPQSFKAQAGFIRPVIEATKKAIKAIEKKIQATIESDPELKEMIRLATSVPGVGLHTALAIVFATQGFTILTDPRKLACYAGVAPFEHQSGTSIRGRTRVSRKANTELKTLLHLAAMASCRFDPEIKAYFHRKVSQGKHKMAVINAVRNKLLARVLSVVRKGSAFQKKAVAA